jgi:hypothetical protein
VPDQDHPIPLRPRPPDRRDDPRLDRLRLPQRQHAAGKIVVLDIDDEKRAGHVTLRTLVEGSYRFVEICAKILENKYSTSNKNDLIAPLKKTGTYPYCSKNILHTHTVTPDLFRGLPCG